MGCKQGKQVDQPQQQKANPKQTAPKKDQGPILDKKKMIENKDKAQPFTELYQIGKLLGRGSFASVHKAEHIITKKFYAVKIIQKKSLSEDEMKVLIQEMKILTTLDHPNIMSILEYYDEPNFFYIVMDYYQGEQFFESFVEDDELTEEKIKGYFRSILLALNYALQNNIMHCDLKPDNIIFDLNSEKKQLKILDWGLAQYYEKKVIERLIGTPLYMAPEVTNKKIFQNSDMWSVGIMLYEAITGAHPFMEYVKKIDDLFRNIRQIEPDFTNICFEGISKECIDVIKALLNKDPSQRPSAAQILEYPWFKNTDQQNNTKIQKTNIDSLKYFCKTNQIQKIIFMYFANFFINNENKNDLAQEFQKLDKNKDGTLSKQEFLMFKQQLQMTEKEISDLFDQIDMNKNDKIDFNEFILAASEKQKIINQDSVKKAFDMLDVDKNNFISVNELALVFGQMNLENDQWQDLMKNVDKNNDGQLNISEFSDMLFQMVNQP